MKAVELEDIKNNHPTKFDYKKYVILGVITFGVFSFLLFFACIQIGWIAPQIIFGGKEELPLELHACDCNKICALNQMQPYLVTLDCARKCKCYRKYLFIANCTNSRGLWYYV